MEKFYVLCRKNARHVGPVVYDDGLVLHSGPYEGHRAAIDAAKAAGLASRDYVLSTYPDETSRGKCSYVSERKGPG